MSSRIAWLHEITQYDLDNRISIPKWMDFVRKIRTGTDKFDCNTEKGRFDLYVWWVEYGRHDYRSFNWVLSESDEIYLFSDAERPLPRALQMYANLRPDLMEILSDIKLGVYRLLVWWFSDGSKEPFVAYTIPMLFRRLVAHNSLPLPLVFIWRIRPDLQNIFNLENENGCSEILEWWNKWGKNEYPLMTLWATNQEINLDIPSSLSRDTNCFVDAESQIILRGVNVIGFSGGVLGIGEDARMAAAVISKSGIDVANLQPQMLEAPTSFPELAVGKMISRECYTVSLFCLPPIEMIRLAIEADTTLIESTTYKIGAWPWELPGWPNAFNGIGNLVDEIWAPSRYVKNSYSSIGASTGINIHYVPLAVDIPRPTENLRNKYALPNDSFLFYLMFDGNSWLSRKNPIAGVKAFREAFSDQLNGVGLVIKAMNIRPGQPMWEDILAMTSNDDRIHIITDTLSRQEVINLMASCDAYISLHRSEGFGRVIAEAMLLGQPTVTTNYSGNVDFCNSETSFLVNGDLVPLLQGEYVFSEGQYWCDPDIRQAVGCLREVFEDEGKRRRIADAGKKFIKANFSIDAVGDIYRKRFAAVFDQLNCR